MISGTFTSNWSNTSISTPGTLDLISGKIKTQSINVVSELGTLESEEFTTVDGKTYDVCPSCHEHILRTKMIPDQVGKGLHEVLLCSDPECEYNEQ